MLREKTAVLYFIAFGHDHGQTIAICLRRNVYDNPPPRLHWYMQGESLNYHVKKGGSFFGWSCIAAERDIAELLVQLKSSTVLKDYAGKDIKIGFPTRTEFEELSNPDISQYLLPGIPAASDAYQRKSYTILNWEEQVGRHIQGLIDEKITNAIAGYKTDLTNVPRPIPPLGFIGRGKLLRELSGKVVLLEEPYGIDLNFRGIGNLEKKQLSGYKGTVRGLPDDSGPFKIQFLTKDENFVGETEVLSSNGWAVWIVNAEGKSVSSGIVRILDKTGQPIAGEKFYLLMEIGLDVVPVSGKVKDLYGRALPIVKNALRLKPPGLIHWEPSYKEQPESLSDKLGLVLTSLGPKVLIHDPYGFGFLDLKGSAKLITNDSCKCFFNAIVVALTKEGIKEVLLLIDLHRLGLPQEAADALIDGYKKLFEPLKALGLTRFELGFASTTFHDRYWVSMGGSVKLCRSSKSITGLLETDELDISFESGPGVPMKFAQILAHWDAAQKRTILG